MPKMSADLVTVIIPCYNAEKYISEAISSVLNQTYKPIEIIVVNDGSTDQSEKRIEAFGDQVYYLKQTNQGVSQARNTGFDKASGQYICFMDADDWFYPDNIEQKMNCFKNNPQVGLVHSMVDVTDDKLTSSGKYLKGQRGKNITQALLNMELPIPCPSNALIKKEVLEKVGVFNVDLSTSADFELWLRICQQYEVEMVDTPGIKYRQHQNNMFSDKRLFKKDIQYIIDKYAVQSPYNWRVFLHKNNFSLVLNSIKQKKNAQAAYFLYNHLKIVLKQPIIINKYEN